MTISAHPIFMAAEHSGALGQFDVVIVGARSAGCVLASRLSENPQRSVLRLEAGPDYGGDASGLPAGLAEAYKGIEDHDWGYVSSPDCLGRTVKLARGRVVGGSSAVNSVFAMHGQPADCDGWAAVGNARREFEKALPFFRRLEHDLDFANERHGRNGPIPIRRYRGAQVTPIQSGFAESVRAAGYPWVEDLNAPGSIGLGPTPLNEVDGIRQSTSLTCLADARDRPNLTIRTDVLVDRVLIQGFRAIGVELAEPMETLHADCVMLAAGSYGSPAILLRSGIGPAQDLQNLGTAVHVDLPGVGANLQDHALLYLQYQTRDPVQRIPTQAMLTWHDGLRTDQVSLHLFPHGPIVSEPGPVLCLLVGVMQPLSRGRLRLASRDPRDPPHIALGLLSHQGDLETMMSGVALARRLALSAPLKNHLTGEKWPGSDVRTDDQVAAAVRSFVVPYNHPVGTCRMGQGRDPWAVVDSRGTVHGMEGLLVADGSIMPTIPATNTNIPTIMLAERIASLNLQRSNLKWLKNCPASVRKAGLIVTWDRNERCIASPART